MNNILTIRGEDTISFIKSWQAWRKITGKTRFGNIAIPVNEHGICTKCSGKRIVNEKKYGVIRCICALKEFETLELQNGINNYESAYTPTLFPEFIEWKDWEKKDYDQITDIKAIKKACQNWCDNPNTWLILYGNVGCGKTMLMQTINTYLTPWSLYITMQELEQLIFSSMKDDTYQMLVEDISSHPILLLDDVGADYGSDFVKSTTRKIIDYRYRLHGEHPTMISTNTDLINMTVYDRRIGDRIYDQSKNEIYDMTKISSFRKKGEPRK